MSTFDNIPEGSRLAINRMVAVTEKEKKLLHKALDLISADVAANTALIPASASGTCTPTFTGETGSSAGSGYWRSVNGLLHISVVMVWDGTITGSDVTIDLDLPDGGFVTQPATDGGTTILHYSGSGSISNIEMGTPVPLGVSVYAGSNIKFNKDYSNGSKLQYTDLTSAASMTFSYTGWYTFT